MNYKEAMALLHASSGKGGILGLERIEKLLDLLGHPERELQYIHVTGTNGKGSVSYLTASILRESGYRVGLFTSPFLDHYEEQIRVDGCEIDQASLCQLTGQMEQALKSMEDWPTEFELTVVLAFLYFRKMHCDLVVLEVGMGGAGDATNVIPAPEAAVLVSIDLDHTAFLGNTIEEIAEVKSGIIKPGCTVISAPQTREAETVIRSRCQEVGADLIQMNAVQYDTDLCIRKRDWEGQVISYGKWQDLKLGLLGDYQARNACVVLELVETLRNKGWKLPDAAVRRALSNASWQGRFEVVSWKPRIVIDGAHNPHGVRALAENLRGYLKPGERCIALVGILADKDYRTMLELTLPYVSQYITITPPNPRALSAEDCAKTIGELGGLARAAGSVEEGARLALDAAGEEDMICAFGSLYSVASVRQSLIWTRKRIL